MTTTHQHDTLEAATAPALEGTVRCSKLGVEREERHIITAIRRDAIGSHGLTCRSAVRRLRRLRSRGDCHEEDVPAEPPSPEQDARVPPADEDSGRKKRAEAASREGAQAADRVAEGVARIPPSRLSLPRRVGIRRAAEIQALFQQGNRHERSSFVALWRAQGQARRVAFAVSRRLGTAAKRNRTRRRIREAYRHEQHALRPGVEIVFVARPPGLKKPFAELLQEMRSALTTISRSAAPEGGRGL